MLKVTLGTLTTIFCITALIVVFYWRDVGFDPSYRDLAFFFVLLPILITTCILSPLYIMKWLEYRKEKVEKARQISEEGSFDENQTQSIEPSWSKVSLYASSSLHAFGENQEIKDAIQVFLGPELDSKLTDQYGLPLVSYRIKDLEILEEDQELHLSELQLRLMSLIQGQFQSYSDQIHHVIEHIKKSTMFYDQHLAYEYKIHPAWINSDYQDSDLDIVEEEVAEQVDKLSYFNVHIIVTDSLVHSLDEAACSELIEEDLFNLGILKQQIQTHFHYWDEKSAYQNWLNLLKAIGNIADEFSCIIVVDSEINQDIIDEKTFISDSYIPAEFASSCLVASIQTKVNNLLPEKTIHIVENEKNLINSLIYLNIDTSSQYEHEQPFVVILDSIGGVKVSQKINQVFSETPIDAHHFLFPKLSLGNTQTLSDIWGGMLAMQTYDDGFNLAYSVKNYKNQLFILPCKQDDSLMNS